jgi:glycosyltransferase involved in cell wall biosynthesis
MCCWMHWVILDKETLKKIKINIYGSGLGVQKESFREKIIKLCRRYRRNVTLFGRYQIEDLPEILQENRLGGNAVGLVENSPLVIQESFNYGRPLLVSNIGGMAEKVTDGKNGLHFPKAIPRLWHG